MARTLTRQEVLTWRENWSSQDKVLIECAIDVLPERDFYEPDSKAYAGARVARHVALYVCPGFLYWAKTKWLAGIDPNLIPGGLSGTDEQGGGWYKLSTYRERASAARFVEELRDRCPKCFVVPSVSGACNCD